MPALPLHQAGPYVAAAYIVFMALILIYVVIMATRLSRMERSLGELHQLADARPRPDAPSPGPVSGAGAQIPAPSGDEPVAGASR